MGKIKFIGYKNILLFIFFILNQNDHIIKIYNIKKSKN